MKSSLVGAAAILAVLTGCAASPEAPAPAEQTSTTDRVYRPGSNILVKDRTPLTKEEKEKQAEDARNALSNSPRPGVVR
jgi:hypothetical protein